MKKEDMSKAFSDEAEFEETYVRFLENLPPAWKGIPDSHERLDACFLDYLDAFERWVFRHAYEGGYVAAMERIGGADGGTGAAGDGQDECQEAGVFGQLKREALYAQRSFSEEQLHEVYGKAKMARELEAITKDEFMEINHMTVCFMNTDREFIRRKSEEFFRGGTESGEGEPMKEYRVRYWDRDGVEKYRELDSREHAQGFYDRLDGKAEIQRYIEERHGYETVVYPTFEV